MRRVTEVAVATAIALMWAGGNLFAGGFCAIERGGCNKMMTGVAPCSMHKHHGDMWMCGVSDLNLTETQKATLKQLDSELKTNMDALRSDAKNPLKEALSSGAVFDKAKFIDAMNTNHAQMVQLMADYAELRYNVLTDEQKAKLIENMSQTSTTTCSKRGFKHF